MFIMSIIVDPNNYSAVINAQHEWLKILQNEQPKTQILIKAIEGRAPEKADNDLYRWLPFFIFFIKSFFWNHSPRISTSDRRPEA